VDWAKLSLTIHALLSARQTVVDHASNTLYHWLDFELLWSCHWTSQALFLCYSSCHWPFKQYLLSLTVKLLSVHVNQAVTDCQLTFALGTFSFIMSFVIVGCILFCVAFFSDLSQGGVHVRFQGRRFLMARVKRERGDGSSSAKRTRARNLGPCMQEIFTAAEHLVLFSPSLMVSVILGFLQQSW